MMKPEKQSFDFRSAKYNVSGVTEISMDLALRLWRAKFETPEHFRRVIIRHSSMKEFYEFVQEMWDSIEPVTVQEAFSQKNAEMRRVYFECIGVIKIFKELEPELVDKQILKKKRAKWDDQNVEDTFEFEDVYELYRIPTSKLFGGIDDARFSRGFSSANESFVYAVRCWCTSTAREYWLYVDDRAIVHDDEVEIAKNIWQYQPKRFDAIKAIAWTIRIGITKPEKIYRQGDVIIAKASADSTVTILYHLGKKEYLELMYSES
jgi:hypothetical protein